jgi:hypothetical protein
MVLLLYTSLNTYMHEDIAEALPPEVGTLFVLLPHKYSLYVIARESIPHLLVSKKLQEYHISAGLYFDENFSMQEFNQISLTNSSTEKGSQTNEKALICFNLVLTFMHSTRNTLFHSP